MESLYIDRRDTVLNVEGERLLVFHPEMARAKSVPLSHLKFLVVSANTSLNTNVLQALSRAGVSLIALNPRKSDDAAFILPFRHGHAQRRMAQYAFWQDAAARREASRRLVAFKVVSQCRTLTRLLRHHPQERRALSRALDILRGISERLRETDLSLESLRGLEGAAAAAYFSALGYCVPASLGFTGRKRRPPTDPVNVLLSLTYTLAHCEAVRALSGVGLDPLLGFYHDLSYRRESLACDLVETLRPRIDDWVIRQFNRQVMRLDHFSTDERLNGACQLGKAGRAVYYASYESAAQHWRRLLRRLARRWANSLMDAPETTDAEENDHE